MDSGNNSTAQSLQSTSTGPEEECDSRATATAAVQDSGQISTTHHLHLHLPQQPFNHHLNQTNNLNPMFFSSSPQNQLLDLDSAVWSNTLPSFSDHHLSTTTTNPIPPARNPKKRSRASRRAPTTVLTTDTNNFRSMVQQYTGIPSLSPETSLDLFGTRSNLLNLRPNLYYSSPSFINDSCINLLNTMQNPITFPYNNNNNNNNNILNLKYSTQNPNSSHGFGGIGQTHIHQHHMTTLPDLLSTAVTPTTTSSRNDDPVASGNWETISGMKGDQGFIEPWT